MRVLVADDDPLYRNLIADLLRKWQFEPVLASDGEEALLAMEAPGAPRLVILDWMMPRMDGYEVARVLRSRQATEGTFVLLITGSRNKRDIMKVLVCGADDYLIKPFEPIDLQIHLRTASRILHAEQELSELRRSRTPQPAAAP